MYFISPLTTLIKLPSDKVNFVQLYLQFDTIHLSDVMKTLCYRT